MVVAYLPEPEQERSALPKTERAALINADAKLGAYGPLLGYPHTSAARDTEGCGSFGPGPRAAPRGRCTGRRSGRC